MKVLSDEWETRKHTHELQFFGAILTEEIQVQFSRHQWHECRRCNVKKSKKTELKQQYLVHVHVETQTGTSNVHWDRVFSDTSRS